MTSFCNCSTCLKVKEGMKRRKPPTCPYCKERHDTRIHCIEEMRQRKPLLRTDEICPACNTVHDSGRIDCPDIDEEKKRIKADSEYFIDVADGKYTVYQEKSGALKALRYGEPWQDLTGNNLVFNLMVGLIEAKEKIAKAIHGINVLSHSNYETIEVLKGQETEE